jgi:L-alanine-DL-glutamate epimerase-like enolase superfamily enzyme
MAACAISAIDTALWDLKAKLLDVPLVELFGAARDDVPVYGSGGFTNEGPDELVDDVERWRSHGIRRFKIKVGRDRAADRARIDAVVASLRDGEALFVDANGAYAPKDASSMAAWMGERGVAWFEEPVSSDDRLGLRFVRERAPPCMQVAAGEYAYTPDAFRALLESEAVDVLQADATRCLGFTGFLQAAALCEAWHRPLSSHCAPALHAAVMCHVPRAVHMEYFHDHARIESMLFDGAPAVVNGSLAAPRDRPGHGMSLRHDEAARYETGR